MMATYIAAYEGSLKTFAEEAQARSHAFAFANAPNEDLRKQLIVYELVQRSVVRPMPIVQPPRRHA